jgi:hypothetical protein
MATHRNLSTLLLIAAAIVSGCDSFTTDTDPSAGTIPPASAGQGLLTVVNASSSEITAVYFSDCASSTLTSQLKRSIAPDSARAWYADAGCYHFKAEWSSGETKQIELDLPDRGSTSLLIRDSDRAR